MPYTDTVFDTKHLHKTQEALLRMGDMEEDCLLLHAPTGSGKTYGFGLPSLRYEKSPLPDGTLPRTLIITPTNALIHQTVRDLENDWKSKSIKVTHISSKCIKAKGWNRALEIYDKVRDADIIVSNPDMITLLMGSYYYRKDGTAERNLRITQWSALFKNIRFIIFDEYHIYQEDEIARIITFLILSKATGSNHVKACMSSATPNEKIKNILEKYNIRCKEVTQDLSEQTLGTSLDRKVKGNLKVVFTDNDIDSSIEEVIGDTRKTLFIYNNLKRALNAQDYLYNSHVSYGSFLGLDTKRNQPEAPPERIIIATNKAELGLNMNIQLAHIEPGLYSENFWQRFGRAARQGQDGEVVVHVGTDIMKNLPLSDEVKTYKDFVSRIDSLFVKRDSYAKLITSYVGAYLYHVKINSTSVLANQVHNMASIVPGSGMYKAFESAEIMLRDIRTISEETGGIGPDIINGLIKWWYDDFLKSFWWFRGQAVEALYSSHIEKHKDPVPYSLKWIQENCVYEIIKDDRGRRIYISTRFHDVKRPVEMRYAWVTGTIVMRGDECYKNIAHREKWKKAFNDLERLTRADKKVNEIMQRFVSLFVSTIILTINTDLLKPTGVDVIDNFI